MSFVDSLEFWTEMIRLDGYRVAHVRRDRLDDPIQLTVVPTDPIGVCPRCNHASTHVHRRQQSDPIRDLPMGTQAIELIFSIAQYECTACGCFFTPASPGATRGTHATERFLAQAARLIRFSDVANAAAYLEVPEKTLEKWYYDYVTRQQQTPPPPTKPIVQIGIDELAIKKKAPRYVAVIVDHTNDRVLEVLPSREKSVVLAYLQHQRTSGLLAQVAEVTTDMWPGYVEAARAAFGENVRITIDRFHVMKQFQDHLTTARRAIQKQLPKDARKALKGTRWLWLTNDDHLTADELTKLQRLQKQYPLLGQLRDQREQLRNLFEDRTIATAGEGAKRLRQWMQQARSLGLSALNGFCETLERWLEKIANYFVRRASNGRVEGFNQGIRGILRRTFGMFNFTHFRLRVLDCFRKPFPC